MGAEKAVDYRYAISAAPVRSSINIAAAICGHKQRRKSRGGNPKKGDRI